MFCPSVQCAGTGSASTSDRRPRTNKSQLKKFKTFHAERSARRDCVWGLPTGLTSMTVPVYIAETSPAHIRGRMITLFQLTITLGFFVSAVEVGLFSRVEDKSSWRFVQTRFTMSSAGARAQVVILIAYVTAPGVCCWPHLENTQLVVVYSLASGLRNALLRKPVTSKTVTSKLGTSKYQYFENPLLRNPLLRNLLLITLNPLLNSNFDCYQSLHTGWAKKTSPLSEAISRWYTKRFCSNFKHIHFDYLKVVP